MSIDLLKRAAQVAHDESNRLHYLYNDQSWGNAPDDVFNKTRYQYARKTRQQFLFEAAVRNKTKKVQS